jgi:cobalt-zinc-cadmium efflux system outer membrane protein
VSKRCGFVALLAGLFVVGGPTFPRAQTLPDSSTSRYVDPIGGLSLEQAVARALENEPSLRAVRGEIDMAKAARLQSGLRPNPSLSFERRDEPGGTDNLTTVSIMWPLDLFRRTGRVGVADREVTIAGLAAADRERLLAAEVRTQYGAVLASVREAAIFDEVIATIRKQHELLRARATEGASPPLDRDVLDIELRRLRADQVMRIGRVETAMVSLKRLLGMRPDASLTVRDTLEAMVLRESSAPSGDQPAVTSAPATIDERRADVRQAAVRVDLAEAKLDRAEREGRFDVSLFASYMRMDSGFAQRGFGVTGELERVRGQFNYISAGATVMLPLHDRKQGDMASAKAERATAAASLDASRLNAEAETASARLQYDRARQALNLYGDGTRPLARQNLTVVGQSYELGRVTVFDVLAEQRRYLDVENAYTDVLRAAYDARTALNLALGDVK